MLHDIKDKPKMNKGERRKSYGKLQCLTLFRMKNIV